MHGHDDRDVNVPHPSPGEVGEQVVNVDDVRSKGADGLERRAAAARSHSQRGPQGVKDGPLEIVRMGGEELDFVAELSKRSDLRLDGVVLSAREPRRVETMNDGYPDGVTLRDSQPLAAHSIRPMATGLW